MNKYLNEVKQSLADAQEKAKDGSMPLHNLYMIAPILYMDKHNSNNEQLFQEMIDANDEQVTRDWSLDDRSKEQYKFHYVSSYLYCFVIAGKFDEFKYDKIMEYVSNKMDLFTNDYDGL